MEDKVIAAISIKGDELDANGVHKYKWATKKQAERLLEAQFDEKENRFLFMLGDESIRPCDISNIKFVKLKEVKEWPSFRKYIVKELEAEEERNKLDEANDKNIGKIERMKQNFINNHSLESK